MSFYIAGPHLHYDGQFPGVCFLGKPLSQKVPVQSKPVTIAPPGLGVSMKIPPGAVPPNASQPVSITLQACLSGSFFKYPEGCTPLSAVYHISANLCFKKEVELTFEHFAELKTEKETSKMAIFRAESVPVLRDGREVFIFTPIEGGKFEAGGNMCTLSTQAFSLVSAGTKKTSEMGKK